MYEKNSRKGETKMKKLNLKKAVTLIMAASMLVASAGCAGSKSDDGRDSEGNLHVAIGGTPDERTEDNAATYDLFMENKASFEEKNPGIIIDADPWGFDLQNYMTKAEANDLPNSYNTSPTELNNIIENGYAKDITAIVEKFGYDKALNNEKYGDLYMRDGKYYGIPLDESLYDMGIAYNVELFKQAGLVDAEGMPKFPQTWEELAETAKTIKDKTGKKGIALATTKNQGGWHFLNILWAYGAEMMENKDGKWTATFASEEGVAALQYIKDLKWKYDVIQDELLADLNVGARLFSTNDAAMIITQSSQLSNYVKQFDLDITNVAMSKMPAGPAGRYSQIGGNLLVFSGTDEQVEVCFKWLDHIGQSYEATDDAKAQWEKNAKIAHDEKKLVGIQSAATFINEDRIKAKSEINDKYRTVEERMFKDYTDGEGVTYKFEPERCVQQMYAALDTAIQEVLTNKDADCKAVLEKTQKEFQMNYLDKEV